MNFDLKNLKKLCAQHFIFDAYQYVEGALSYLKDAELCAEITKNLIYRETSRYNLLINKICESRDDQLSVENFAHFSYTNGDLDDIKLNVCGAEVHLSWMLKKCVQDFFNSIRNVFDVLSQALYFAFICNSPNENEICRIDFNKINEILQKENFDKVFLELKDEVKEIIKCDEYMYINDFNNRTKHIHPVKVKICNDFFSPCSKFTVEAFEKDVRNHPEKDVKSIIDISLKFTHISFEKLVGLFFIKYTSENVPRNEISDTCRIHNVSYYSQFDYNPGGCSYTILFIPVENSIDELANKVQILPLAIGEDDVKACNLEVNEILVCSGDGSSNDSFCGKFTAEEENLKNDGLLHYRTYIKDPSIKGFAAVVSVLLKSTYLSKPTYLAMGPPFNGKEMVSNFPVCDSKEESRIKKLLQEFRNAPVESSDSFFSIKWLKENIEDDKF